MMDEDFEEKLQQAQDALHDEWGRIRPQDITVAFMCLWRVAQVDDSMAKVWADMSTRLPRATKKFEEAWPKDV